MKWCSDIEKFKSLITDVETAYEIHTHKANWDKKYYKTPEECLKLLEEAEQLISTDVDMELSFKRGDVEEGDMYLDMPPYETGEHKYHICLLIGPYASTSYGIIIKKHL